MTVQALEGAAVAGANGAGLKRRYLEMRARVGGPAGPDTPAFVAVEGAPLSEAGFDEHLRTFASVRIAMEFNGAICRGLLAARERAAGEPARSGTDLPPAEGVSPGSAAERSS